MLHHRADIEVDLLRFFPQFGPDPLAEIDGPRFFQIAERLATYDGALAAAFRRLIQQQDAAQPAPAPRAAPAAPVTTGAAAQPSGELHHGIRIPKGARVVPFAEMALANPDLIGFKKVG